MNSSGVECNYDNVLYTVDMKDWTGENVFLEDGVIYNISSLSAYYDDQYNVTEECSIELDVERMEKML